MKDHVVHPTVNGRAVSLLVPASMTLLELLRERLALTGAKPGCQRGDCGACVVLLDGQPVNSCLVLAVQADGCEIRTVEQSLPLHRVRGHRQGHPKSGRLTAVVRGL
jgi:aerobic-type carbon monoxide dehydrogenase small subunit (CoxS/CutS family)